jgi:hypothetical protein
MTMIPEVIERRSVTQYRHYLDPTLISFSLREIGLFCRAFLRLSFTRLFAMLLAAVHCRAEFVNRGVKLPSMHRCCSIVLERIAQEPRKRDVVQIYRRIGYLWYIVLESDVELKQASPFDQYGSITLIRNWKNTMCVPQELCYIARD